MLISASKELKFFTKPQETLMESLQEKSIDSYSYVYYPYQGA